MTDADVAAIATDPVVEDHYSGDVVRYRPIYTCNQHPDQHGGYVGTLPCPLCWEATGPKNVAEPEWRT
jgi:hypothetical protein